MDVLMQREKDVQELSDSVLAAIALIKYKLPILGGTISDTNNFTDYLLK